MKVAFKKRGESVLDELAKTYELVRETLLERVDDIDTDAYRKRGGRVARSMRARVEQRIRPRRRRRFPIAGLLLAGTLAGLGYLLYDRRRRDMVRGRLTQVQVRTKERLDQMGGVQGAVDNVMSKVRPNGQQQLDETALKTEVEKAIAAGGAPPQGLQVAVEGRTVYLRGTVDNPAFVDAAAERAQSVEGVAAVVNLTSSPQAAPRSNRN